MRNCPVAVLTACRSFPSPLALAPSPLPPLLLLFASIPPLCRHAPSLRGSRRPWQVLCLPLCCVCWCRIYVDDLAESHGTRDVPVVDSPLAQLGPDSGPGSSEPARAAAAAEAAPAQPVSAV